MNFGMVPLNVLGTAYVVDSLKAGPQLLSFMHLALVAGMGLGAFITPKLERFSHRNMFVLSGFVVSSAVASLWYFPLMAETILRMMTMIGCLFLFGIGGGVQNVIFGAAFMRHVDKDYLGRVGGVTNAILCAAMPAGAFLCSLATKFLPVPSVFLISAGFSFILYAVVTRISILRNL